MLSHLSNPKLFCPEKKKDMSWKFVIRFFLSTRVLPYRYPSLTIFGKNKEGSFMIHNWKTVQNSWKQSLIISTEKVFSNENFPRSAQNISEKVLEFSGSKFWKVQNRRVFRKFPVVFTSDKSWIIFFTSGKN